MLTAEETAQIDREITKFPVRRSACLEALGVVQKHRGWVSDEALKSVADYLGMSATELDGIATFYNLIYRKPVGKKVIRICESVTCFILGYDQIRAQIEEELGIKLGQTTPDGEFTLLPTPCLGTCDKAPAMMINDVLHRNLRKETIGPILREKQNPPA
ncbi:MAG: NADH-quinone oxidoreductase subunit NuoE [Myxococcaceae bacterium]|nr:NADH-quinone oxidoreductase subunit NuoE [Myxococcaceae bacterium]MBH2005877.1 NADH-quinone oxidoreductase subunit NuoE [Myxococcaceae bacterium]